MSLGRIGAYRITGELGRGGIGVVYGAIDPSGRKVALKRLLTGSDPGTDERLLREASIRIEHPNVVRTLAGGLGGDGRPYIVLELLEGTTLREALGAAEAEQVVDWVRQAAQGVAAIHGRGVVHRDLKPENLFLTRDGTVKVLDLGIAAFVDERARLTQTGAVIGTPAYLAPEQIRGVRQLDPRVDVWALGVILHEGLTGQPLFRRDGTLSTMLAVSVDPIPLPSTLDPRIPAALDAIVERCLEREAGRRMPSAEALADALTAFLDTPAPGGLPRVSATPPEADRPISVLLALGDATHCAEAIAAAEGEPLLLGDGRVLGLFGAVVSRGDEATRALEVGRALAGTCRAVALGLGRGALRARVAAGDAVREVEEALARAPAGLVCGPLTARALRGTVAVEEIAPALYRIGETDRRLTTLTPLLARDVELAMLRRARDTALGETRAVLTWIVGGPGAGKTRLVESVRGLLAEPEPPLAAREAVARPSAPSALGLLLRALGVEGSAAKGSTADATVHLDIARGEVIDALRALAVRGPLALLLEDVQWADPPSLALLAELPRHLGDLPVWIVATARPEALERLPERPDRSQIVEPSPLGAREVVEMARARGRGPLPLRVAQALAQHTGGNPLFVELILDAEGALEADLETRPLPISIEHAVQARLDQLGSEEHAALIRLAVLGRPADTKELTALGVAQPDAALERLAALDLVARGTGPDGRTYRTRSPVVAQVAERSIPTAQRRALHRGAAHVAELRGRDEEEVALHREAAGESEEAAQAYLAAALGAARGGDARKVLRCAERARRLSPGVRSFALSMAQADAARWAGDGPAQARALDDAQADAQSDAERAAVHGERGEMLRRRGDAEGALVELARASELARGASDADTLVRAACHRAIAEVAAGRHTEAERALAEVDDVRPPSPAIAALRLDTLGFLAGSRGDVGAREAAFAAAARLYASIGDLRRAAGAETNAADAMSRLGRYGAAEAALRRGVEAARRVGNRLTEGYALVNLGWALTALGRAAEAQAALREASAIATAIADPHLLEAARYYAARASGDTASEAVFAELGEAAGSMVIRAGALAERSRRALARGEVAEARRLAERALQLRDEAGGLEEGEAEVFLAAARALEAAGARSEARQVRARGVARLDALAARIQDEATRRAFLDGVPEHRALREG